MWWLWFRVFKTFLGWWLITGWPIIRAELLIQLWMRSLHVNKEATAVGEVRSRKHERRQLSTEEWTVEKGNNVDFCSQQAKVLNLQSSGLSVMQWVSFQMHQMQRRADNMSKCCHPTSQLWNTKYAELAYQTFLHSSHACVAHHMPL